MGGPEPISGKNLVKTKGASIGAVMLADALIASGAKDPVIRHALSMVKGFRNGIVYGAKVRATHSLLMCIIFKKGSWQEKAKFILEATYTHASNLARLVFLYKGLMALQKYVSGGPRAIHPALSGALAGYLIFGKFNKVNEQVCLYLLSRVVYASAQLVVEKGLLPRPSFPVYPWFAACMWAWNVWMFNNHRDTLQFSLRSSMTYLFEDSEETEEDFRGMRCVNYTSPLVRRLLAMLNGARNGIIYGTKVRAPHSLLMCIVFKGGSIREKLRFIARATYIHAKNLASVVFTYKGLVGLLEYAQQRHQPWHTLLGGFVAGYLVFGQYNKVNEQVCLYLLSRLLYASAHLLVKKGVVSPKLGVVLPTGGVVPILDHAYPCFAACVWAAVMYLFTHHQPVLQPSLQNSMTYLYRDSDKFTNLHTLLVHNSCDCG